MENRRSCFYPLSSILYPPVSCLASEPRKGGIDGDACTICTLAQLEALVARGAGRLSFYRAVADRVRPVRGRPDAGRGGAVADALGSDRRAAVGRPRELSLAVHQPPGGHLAVE